MNPTGDQEPHPALATHLQERLNYARLVAAIVAANGEVNDAEVGGIRDLCRQLQISDDDTAATIDVSHAPDPIDVRDRLYRLRASDLRFTLVTDMVALGWVDGTYDIMERKQVRSFAAMMSVSEQQVAAIEDAVEVALGLTSVGPDHEPVAAPDLTWMTKIVAPLAAVGVPASAVVAVAPHGVTPGPAVVAGLTTLGVGLGPVAGLGVAAALGVGTFVGFRVLQRIVVGTPHER